MEHFIGFDGGGTKTEMLVVDAQQQEIYRAIGGASNPKAVGPTLAVAPICKLLDDWFNGQPKHESCRGICLGIAGVATTAEREELSRLVSEHLRNHGEKPIPVYVTNDAEIGLMAGLRSHTGIIAIAGTGSIVYGITAEGHHHRAGGWGHILGDKGSGYDIGLTALQSVMSAFDGLLPPTMLTELILEQCGLASPSDLRTHIYSQPFHKGTIASYAATCIQAAKLGDAAALKIIRTAAEALADLTSAVRLRDASLTDAAIAITGSIFEHSEVYRSHYIEYLSRHPMLSAPVVKLSTERPVFGAALIATERSAKRH